MSQNITDITGIRLVIDKKTGEFYLFSESDNRAGLIHGNLGQSTFHFNTKRGSDKDGIFSGALIVENIPFEYTKYSDAHIKHILDAKPNDESQSQIEKDKSVTKSKFSYFNPDKYLSGEVTSAPKSLSRSKRGKWYDELKIWKEEQDNLPKPNPSVEAPTETKFEGDPSIEEVKVTANIGTPKKKVEPYAGSGNTYQLIEDVPEGYIIGYLVKGADEKQYLYVLGTPMIPATEGKAAHKRYFVCKEERTANQLLSKLKDEPYYSKWVKDGTLECKVMPVTNLPLKTWKEEALLVVNVYTLLNSALMLTVNEE